MNAARPILMLAALLLAAITQQARAVTIDMVTVGNAGNAADTTGYGAVNYEYRIGKYEVTIQQYTDFLNAVAKSDPYSLYNTSMASDLNVAGISRSGTSGGYTYSVINNGGASGNRPITYVGWLGAARFANWLTNGQGTGSTESGAYTISTGQITAASRTSGVNTYTLAAPSTLSVGDQVVVSGLSFSGFDVTGIVTSVSGLQFSVPQAGVNRVATGTGSMTAASAQAATNAAFRLPTESEWYKAAYYSPVLNSGSGGYYTYATQSNTAPGNTIGSGANQANYQSSGSGTAVYSVTQLSTYSSGQNYLTDVGAFTNSVSYYGTFDQSGGVYEFTETLSSGGSGRVRRGGWWRGSNASFLSSSHRPSLGPATETDGMSDGFRLVTPVPEPSTWVMGAAGIACAGLRAWRWRKRV